MHNISLRAGTPSRTVKTPRIAFQFDGGHLHRTSTKKALKSREERTHADVCNLLYVAYRVISIDNAAIRHYSVYKLFFFFCYCLTISLVNHKSTRPTRKMQLCLCQRNCPKGQQTYRKKDKLTGASFEAAQLGKREKEKVILRAEFDAISVCLIVRLHLPVPFGFRVSANEEKQNNRHTAKVTLKDGYERSNQQRLTDIEKTMDMKTTNNDSALLAPAQMTFRLPHAIT